MGRVTFPPGFLWGVATASYQIEGSPLADGASPSIWHEWTHGPGRIVDGTNGDVACDHYRRWPEDVQIMHGLGVGAYRFSVSWPRIFPEPHRANRKGLDFYDRLVDALLEAGIEPWLTIFHWDEPAWLERKGGFAHRGVVDHLVEYGSTLFATLGDRVRAWITVNEPSAYATVGYVLGLFPPGHTMDMKGMYHSSHHLLLGHARLSQACHAALPASKVGIALAQGWYTPWNPKREKDRRAARFLDAVLNGFYREPLFQGRYPREVTDKAERYLPPGWEKDMPEMKGSIDFFGMNYYSRTRFRHSMLQPYTRAKPRVDRSAPRSAMWEVYPEGIYNLLLILRDQCGNPPCYVTENGYPLPLAAGSDPVADRERIDYLANHIALVARAAREGADCRGYFCWTLMDNFEWTYGLTMPFGLFHTDWTTLERRERWSARWYRELVRRGWLEDDNRSWST